MTMQSTFQFEISLPSTPLYGTVMILSAVINVSSTTAFSSRVKKKWNKKGTATLRNGTASLTRAPFRKSDTSYAVSKGHDGYLLGEELNMLTPFKYFYCHDWMKLEGLRNTLKYQ